MPVLLRASVGYLFRHPFQLAMALLGICAGVAVMVAVDLANQSSRQAFVMSMDAINGQATHQVVAGPGGVDENVYAALRVDHGIRNVAPIVTGYVRVGDEVLQLLGVDVFAEREFRTFSVPDDFASDIAGDRAEDRVRRFLTEPGAVLMSTATATRLGLVVGDGFTVDASGRRHGGSLVGVFDGNDGSRPDNVVIADIGVAQDWLDMRGRLSRIDVRLVSGRTPGVDDIQRILPPGTSLLTAEGRTQTTVEMSEAFTTNLMAMSLLALLVGLFLIYNSVAFAVLQRRDLVATLRALGVTRQQIMRLILGEAAVIGLLGSVIGVAIGIWLGDRLVVLVARTLSDHYFAVNVTNVTVESFSVMKGLVAGVGAALIAATVPAVEAASWRPRLTMLRSVIEQHASRLTPRFAVLGVAMMLIAALALLVSGTNLVAGLAFLFMLILGFAFCIPAFAGVASRLCEPVGGLIAGTAGRLAIGGVTRSLSRTGVAIIALSIAVSATVGVSIMVGSFRSSVSDWLDNTLQSDVYVGVPGGGLDRGLIPDLVAVAGIEHFSTSRRAWVETTSGRIRIIALEMAPGSYAGTRLRDVEPDEAWRRFDQEGAVLVSDSFAYRRDVGPGDVVRVDSRLGEIALDVAAVYQSYDANDGAIMMSRATYDRLFDDAGIDSLGLYLADGADPEYVMEQLRDVSSGRQSLMMSSNVNLREMSLGIFDRTFVITNVLYWLAVGVAIIGILGAMLALQLERAREFGILRAIGVTPAQAGIMVTGQSGFLGLLAGLAAIPLGLMMAWVLIEVINRRAFGWQIGIDVTAGPLIAALILAVGASVIAGLYPSWRAANAPPALAMREE